MKYDHAQIEKKWQKRWKEERIYEPDLENAKTPFYNLMMFPYPSAEGLHVGNIFAFTGSDIYGRYQRMKSKDVFEPIGLDGFGIHSENYALKIGIHPAEQARISEKRFYKQLESIGNGFAWEEKLETYDPEYYKWTQWIFIQMFKNGLAYRKKSAVNWCPSCQTVLADEQVINGRCERCSTEVIKKELEQWFFKITDYAERLLNNLDKIDWSEKVKIAQRNWIGRSEGAIIRFKIKEEFIEVFTTKPDTIFGATCLVLAPEHTILANGKWQIVNSKEVEDYIKKVEFKTEQERQENKEKTGVELKGVKAINPANGEEIPIWVSDYVLSGYGTGAIMAVPQYDERDREFAEKFNLPIVDRLLVDKDEIIKKIGGEKKVNYKLRDWLISRQRYWGPPIPMIFCEKCEWQPVSEEDLPIRLPAIENFHLTGTGQSPLASMESFYKTKCSKCGGKARRETDVSDTFLDSAWYYFAYLMRRNPQSTIRNYQLIFNNWLPVDMYIGGAEHSVLHLLYSRFLAMAFHDWGLIDFSASSGEPFTKFRAHGLLIKEGAKMSKSKGNVINPDFYIENFGADTLRMYLMFLAPFEQGGDFRDQAVMGVYRFLNKIIKYFESREYFKKNNEPSEPYGPLKQFFHQSIKKVTKDIEILKYNMAISRLMILFNMIKIGSVMDPATAEIRPIKENWYLDDEYAGVFLKLLAPFAPHLTEELWREVLGNKTSIHKESWPTWDEKLAQEEEFELVIQVNSKLRGTILVKKGISQKEAEELTASQPNIKTWLSGQEVKKVIFVPDRLINFLIK